MVFLLAAALVLGFVTAPAGQPAATPDPDQPLALEIRYANGRVVRSNIGPTHSSWTPMFPRIEGWTGPVALPVAAIRYRATRREAGLDMVVSVLRGQQHQEETEIARVTLSDSTPVASHEIASTISFHLQRLTKEFIGEVVAARPRAGNVAATREWFDAAIAAYQDRLSDLSTR